MFATPVVTSIASVVPVTSSGAAESAIIAVLNRRPIVITPASTDGPPIIFVDLDEHSVPAAQQAAAPRPPRTAITTDWYQGPLLPGLGVRFTHAVHAGWVGAHRAPRGG